MLFWALSAGITTYLSCTVDNVFATSGSLTTDVALTLIDLLKTFIRFKVKTSQPLPTLTADQYNENRYGVYIKETTTPSG